MSEASCVSEEERVPRGVWSCVVEPDQVWINLGTLYRVVRVEPRVGIVEAIVTIEPIRGGHYREAAASAMCGGGGWTRLPPGPRRLPRVEDPDEDTMCMEKTRVGLGPT